MERLRKDVKVKRKEIERGVKKYSTSKIGIIVAQLSAEDKKLVERGIGYVWKNN